MPLYILLLNIRTLLDVTEEREAKCVSGWMEWSGYPLDCYDYWSTCGANNNNLLQLVGDWHFLTVSRHFVLLHGKLIRS